MGRSGFFCRSGDVLVGPALSGHSSGDVAVKNVVLQLNGTWSISISANPQCCLGRCANSGILILADSCISAKPQCRLGRRAIIGTLISANSVHAACTCMLISFRQLTFSFLQHTTDHPHCLNMSNVASSSKLAPPSKAATSQKSWARKYKEHLLEHKAEWLNTNEKEEDAVIEATLTAIRKAHSENEDSVPLAENMSEVRNYISC
jgi:hypothetical protein